MGGRWAYRTNHQKLGQIKRGPQERLWRGDGTSKEYKQPKDRCSLTDGEDMRELPGKFYGKR